MQLSELIIVINYLDKVLKEKQFNELYTHMITNLNAALTSPTPEVTEEIKKLKQQIYEAHMASEPKNWSYLKIKLFKDFGAKDLIGSEGYNQIEKIFFEHQTDPKGASTAIQGILDRITVLQGRVTQFIEDLGPLATKEEVKEIEEGMSILQLVFDGDSSIKTINDMEKYANKWKTIIMAFSRLSQSPAEEAIIHSIEKGSLILEIIFYSGMIGALAMGTTKVLGVYHEVLKIRKTSLEVKNLKLINKKIAKELEKEANNLINEESNVISQELIKKYKYVSDDKNEVVNGLNNALKEIFNFVENGGKISTFAEGQEGIDDSSKQLSSAFARIDQIESQIEGLKAITDETQTTLKEPNNLEESSEEEKKETNEEDETSKD